MNQKLGLFLAYKNYFKHVGEYDFETYAEIIIKKRIQNLRTARNNQITIESGLSINQTYNESENTVDSFLKTDNNKFEEDVSFSDYLKHFDYQKQKICKVYIAGYSDEEIMNIMQIKDVDFKKIKAEIKDEFQQYVSM